MSVISAEAPATRNKVEWKLSKLIEALGLVKGDGNYTAISFFITHKVEKEFLFMDLDNSLKNDYNYPEDVAPNFHRMEDPILDNFNQWSSVRDDNIKSIKRRIGEYAEVPEKGLVIFCGTIEMGVDKPTTLCVDFEPFVSADFVCDFSLSEGPEFHTAFLQHYLKKADGSVYIEKQASIMLERLLKDAQNKK